MREHIDLTGAWLFQADVFAEGHETGLADPAHDDSRWRVARVPAVFDRCAPGMASYEGAGWFRRRVIVPESWRGKRIALRFEGVNYHAAAWVNGERAGTHEGGFLPFELPVHDLLRFGEENLVAVRADNVRRKGEVPGLERGWRPFGGVLREVGLVACDPLHIDHVRADSVPTEEGGRFALRSRIANERDTPAEVELRVSVFDRAGEIRGAFTSGAAALRAGEETALTLEGEVPGAEAWSPESPALYSVKIELSAGAGPVDSRELRVGFRRIEVDGGRLLLNGRQVFLTGFNRHEDSPRTDACPDVEQARADLADMKEMGANFVRLCHYPHHPRELDLCDEIGLLVMGEIPLYWWNGNEEGEEKGRMKLAAARRQLEGMISRDANHPSVVFWSVSNETCEERPEVARGNAELVRLARELDPTRLAVHVSDRWREHPHFEEDDVLCVNAYPTLAGRSGDPGYDVAESTGFWAGHLEELHARCPGKPLLVTEFGYPSLAGVHEGALGEEMQARAIEAEFAGMSAPYVCGATIWCYADHPWPEEPFISYLTASPYGIKTRERRDLAAVPVVKRLFRSRRGGPQAS